MGKMLFVEQILQEGYFQVLTISGSMLEKAGPLLFDVDNLYEYATENGYTDICIVAGYLHLGGVKN